MDDSTPNIRVIDLKNPAQVEENISSSMIDIAYADGFGPDYVDVYVDEEDTAMNLRDPDDRTWLIGIFQQILAECNENEGKIIFLCDFEPESSSG